MAGDPLFSNKLLGGLLLAGVIATGVGFVAKLTYHPAALNEDSYPIEVARAEEGDIQIAKVDIVQWDEVEGMIAGARAVDGKKLFKRKCSSCHNLAEGGPNKTGPNLWGIVNRPVASAAGFKYSNVLQGMSGKNWTLEELNAFIAKPKLYAPGTKMSYVGLRKAAKRAKLLAYLQSKN